MCAMKTIAIGSFLVLFALVATFAATAPTAFADHAEAHVSIPAGSAKAVGAVAENVATSANRTKNEPIAIVFIAPIS